MRRALILALALGAAGCGDDDGGDGPDIDAAVADAAPAAVFPADYRDSYTEVRDCRNSASHDFHKIRILADPDAVGPYLDRDRPFPVGSIVLKEEFDIGDTDCAGEVIVFTVMQKLEAGSAPELQLDWFWQKLDGERSVLSENASSCFGCHDDCDGNPVDSYDSTCAVP